MAFGTSIGKGSFKVHQQDRWWGYFYLFLLIIAALILLTINLGNFSLNSWETSTAETAKAILQAPFSSWREIFPISKRSNLLQPLFPSLVALSYYLGGVSPLTTRLPAALLSALTTVLVYGIGRELFKTIIPALLACCVYITFFPVIAQGRVAAADAPVICFEMFVIWAILRSRRDLRWSLLAGLGLSLVGLTNVLVFLPLLALIALFLRWDTPRLLTSFYFYGGVILGIIPLIAWWIAQTDYYEPIILEIGNLSNLAIAFKTNFSQEWLSNFSFKHYLATALKYGSPWLVVSFWGLRLAWYHRNWGWAKFLLTASSFCGLFAVLAIAFHFVLPIYPILALAAGRQLHQLRNLPSYFSYPRSWVSLFGSLAMIFLVLGIWGKIVFAVSFNWLLLAIFASVILTLVVSSLLINRKNFQFIYILIWGNYVSLLLFFGSQYGN